MAKTSVQFLCSECGWSGPKWYGRCPECGQWGTIGAGTLMVCLPLMLAFILFQKQFLRSFGFSGIK